MSGATRIREEVRCTAKAKSTGKRCRAPRVKGMSVCKVHGGLSPVGPAAAGYIDGRSYARRRHANIPARLESVYVAALDHPDYLELRSQLALLTAREEELLARLDVAGGWWKDLTRIMGKLRKARASGNTDGLVAALSDLEAVADRADDGVWEALLEIVEARRKLIDSERRAMESDRRMVTRERAEWLAVQVAGAVKRHVKDPKAVSAIYREVDFALRGMLADNDNDRVPG